MLRLAQVLVLTTMTALGVTAGAQSPAQIPLELNRLEQDGDICRVYLLVKNPEETAMEAFKLDLVFFDADGIIRNRLYVELGPLPGAKTAVRPFDIPNSDCGALGSILVNDVVSCSDASGADLDCLGRLELSSRADAMLRY